MKSNVEIQNIEKILDRAKKDKKFRIALAYNNHFWFFMFYFPHYLKYKPANFHRELFKLSEMKDNDLLVCTAFRGSGKSSVMSLSLPIWAIVGKLQKKFVVLTSQTQQQVKQIYDNIKDELESNELLINDFGPFVAEPWNSRTLKVSDYNAQILPVSLGSEIRGIRKRADRPDLVIIDDVDSLSSTRNEDRRKKTIDWFDRDIRQIGEKNSSFVIIGNLLHEQCLVSILKRKILDKQIPGEYREYPLVDEKDCCLWPAKYPTKADLERLEKSVINRSTWLREYLLKVFNDDTNILSDADFDYYDELPKDGDGSRHIVTYISIDPALGEKRSSDPTAIISADVYQKGGVNTLYINPYYINKRLKPVETVNILSEMYRATRATGKSVIILVENTNFQRLFVNLLENVGVNVNDIREVETNGKDKKFRVDAISPYIINKLVKFPRNVYREPIMQLQNPGVEGTHDDLADALVYAISSFASLSTSYYANPISISFDRDSFYGSCSLSYGDEDWGDRDDREIFSKLKHRKVK